ncbi:hypothetical protein [Flavobacterium sp. ASW18X]|uniref:hypothetical protein n=1 Tax=Flavobacterium sp. ASW18X TaxID=2572595 RepID=UPI0010AE55CB|nr:hypothetical protein [Flavobacterium sp. ASW18X]TKD67009.1 hypothetical protein FBT53_00845 [Flavobacterium sp. ASW18X]
MQKLLIICTFFLVCFACKEKAPIQEQQNAVAAEFSFKNMPNPIPLTDKATEKLKPWTAYQDFEKSFDVFRRARNTEDLKLAVTDLIEKETALEKSDYPEAYNIAQIKSRQLILKTFLLKIKGHLDNQQEVKEPVKELLLARNAMRNQFNRILKDTLDTKSILE